MSINDLKAIMTGGGFHHATYRCGCGEGLYIYERAEADGFRGYKLAGWFLRGSPDLPAAEALCRGTGVSVGAYGQG